MVFLQHVRQEKVANPVCQWLSMFILSFQKKRRALWNHFRITAGCNVGEWREKLKHMKGHK